MKRPSGSISGGSGGGGGSPRLVHSDDGFGMEEANEDMVSDMVPSNGFGVKKRRLRTEQVRALERSFETDNKLEPERKAALARDLGLQPRQVAVWFQNRRARWKTKKLERDYFALRHSYDALRADHDAIRRDKDALLHEIKELKAKLGDEDALSWVKEEPAASDVEAPAAEEAAMAAPQGSSDSDSSGVVNDAETAPEEPPPAVTAEAAVAGASSPQLQVQHGGEVLFHGHGHGYGHLLLKVEEDEEAAFLGDDDAACGGFFADLQPPPSLPWWTEPTDHWA